MGVRLVAITLTTHAHKSDDDFGTRLLLDRSIVTQTLLRSKLFLLQPGLFQAEPPFPLPFLHAQHIVLKLTFAHRMAFVATPPIEWTIVAQTRPIFDQFVCTIVALRGHQLGRVHFLFRGNHNYGIAKREMIDGNSFEIKGNKPLSLRPFGKPSSGSNGEMCLSEGKSFFHK